MKYGVSRVFSDVCFTDETMIVIINITNQLIEDWYSIIRSSKYLIQDIYKDNDLFHEMYIIRLFEAREGMIKLVSVHCGIILALTHIGRRVSW